MSGYGSVTTVTIVTQPLRAGILAVGVCVTKHPRTVTCVTLRRSIVTGD
jgi:hypothetical protein